MANWNVEQQTWEVTDAELEAMLDDGERRTTEGSAESSVVTARFLPAERRVIVELENGTAFLFPVDQVQGLTGASGPELEAVEVWGADMLVWPALDAHVSLESLMMGIFGSKAWMASLQRRRGKLGGAVRSDAKAAAARANGKKGGRPKKASGG